MSTAAFVDSAAVLAEHSLVDLAITPTIEVGDIAAVVCRCGAVAMATVGQRSVADAVAQLFEGHLLDTVRVA